MRNLRLCVLLILAVLSVSALLWQLTRPTESAPLLKDSIPPDTHARYLEASQKPQMAAKPQPPTGIYALDPTTRMHVGTIKVPDAGLRPEYYRFPADHPLRARILSNLLDSAAASLEVDEVIETYKSPDEDPTWRFVIIARVTNGDGASLASELRKYWSQRDYVTWNRETIKRPFHTWSSDVIEKECAIRDIHDISSTPLTHFVSHPPVDLHLNNSLRKLARGRSHVSMLFYAQGVKKVVIVHSSPAWLQAE